MTVSRVALPGSSVTLSRMVAGVWRLPDWKLTSLELRGNIERCCEVGVTSFDHADIYGGYSCEDAFGDALTPSLRARIELISKCGIALVNPARPEHRLKHYNTSRAHILASVEQSLINLRTDHLDLLLLHRPDPLLDADEVTAAFVELRDAGKVLAFGVSNYLPRDLELLAARLPFPLVTNQIELHLGRLTPLQDGTLAQCQQLKMPPMAWSPLGGGALSTSAAPHWVRVREVATAIGQRYDGASAELVALAWLLRHPARVMPVLGTGKTERIAELVQAELLQLDRQDWFELWSASAGRDVP